MCPKFMKSKFMCELGLSHVSFLGNWFFAFPFYERLLARVIFLLRRFCLHEKEKDEKDRMSSVSAGNSILFSCFFALRLLWQQTLEKYQTVIWLALLISLICRQYEKLDNAISINSSFSKWDVNVISIQLNNFRFDDDENGILQENEASEWAEFPIDFLRREIINKYVSDRVPFIHICIVHVLR